MQPNRQWAPAEPSSTPGIQQPQQFPSVGTNRASGIPRLPSDSKSPQHATAQQLSNASSVPTAIGQNQLQAARAEFPASNDLDRKYQTDNRVAVRNDQEQHYGLAAELQQNNGRLPSLSARPQTHAPSTASSVRQAAAARRNQYAPGSQDISTNPQTQPNPADNTQQGISQAFIPHLGDAEPEYGLVAELRGPHGNSKAVQGTDKAGFGLAAEVARRRGQGGANASMGIRTRRRLPAGAPADFGLSHELAGRTEQTQPAPVSTDPFSTANRASNADPFVAAEGLIKAPQQPYQPAPSQDQAFPTGPVPLLVHPPGKSVTDNVTKDNVEYGLSEELGVDPADARRQRQLLGQGSDARPIHMGPLLGYDDDGEPIMAPNPPPDFSEPPVPLKFTYDETTGMLIPPENMEGDGGKAQREYMEDVATGRFYRINHEGLLQRIMVKLRRHAPREEDGLQEGQEGYDPDKGTLRGKLRGFVAGVAAMFSLLGVFVQGLLGGWALLTFFMTYFLYSSGSLPEWLRYYAPIALSVNRVFYTLVTMSVIASAARMAQDQLRQWAPRSKGLLTVDVAQLLCYCIAYLTTTLCTPLDDQLQYESDRNSSFWMLSLSDGFNKQLNTWHGLNVIRTVCSGIGWLLCSYQNSAFVRNGVVRHEVEQELLRRTRPPIRIPPDMVMAETPQQHAANRNNSKHPDALHAMSKIDKASMLSGGSDLANRKIDDWQVSRGVESDTAVAGIGRHGRKVTSAGARSLRSRDVIRDQAVLPIESHDNAADSDTQPRTVRGNAVATQRLN